MQNKTHKTFLTIACSKKISFFLCKIHKIHTIRYGNFLRCFPVNSSFYSKRVFWILIANGLNHGEILIYSLLIPWITLDFFPHTSFMMRLVWGYCVLAMGIVTTPLGSFFFSWIAQYKGPLSGMRWCLLGNTLLTSLFIMCPTYEALGILSPMIFFFLRFFKGIFSSGQTSISKIYVIEETVKDKEYKFSYLYQFSSMFGYVGTSVLSNILIEKLNLSWRWGFFPFLLQAGIGMTCFASQCKKQEFKKYEKFVFFPNKYTLQYLKRHCNLIAMVTFTTGLTHITWNLTFIIMNNLIPFATSISFSTILGSNQWLMGIDTVLILILGPLLERYKPEKILKIGSLVLGISLPGCFALLDVFSYPITLAIVRLWILVWGIVFSCPLYMCYKHFCPKKEVYLIVGAGNALGGSIIGKLTPLLTLWIYSKTNNFFSIGIYAGGIALLAWATLTFVKQQE
ncbi:alpha-ketoglutarate transporter [Holospora undulata HU1]|uniref:Alpha-ketoglutarate transporter n=1 Tax=Holospora undulata HU1 TaxID=1321371 RepID=A0A061JH67_9PROT|nr:alpha-ketoglutarate transporter [Holospora undulata HU1]